MKNSETTYLVPVRPLPETVKTPLLVRARYALALGGAALLGGMASAQTGAGLEFDVSSVQTSVMAILGVGVAIAIAFAIYKVGKRGTNKI